MRSGLTHLLQRLPEDMVEGPVVGHTLFDDLPDPIDVLEMDHEVDAPVEGGHVVHGPVLFADQGHEGPPPGGHGHDRQIGDDPSASGPAVSKPSFRTITLKT